MSKSSLSVSLSDVNAMGVSKRPFIRSAFNYDRDAASDKAALHCLDESLAVQSEKDNTDINVILKRMKVTGQMPQGIHAPVYQDFDEVFDYQSAMNAIAYADQAFMRLDPEIRARFMNDPQRFVEFCSDPENLPEMRKMKLAIPEAIKEDKPVDPPPEDKR